MALTPTFIPQSDNINLLRTTQPKAKLGNTVYVKLKKYGVFDAL
jgi:hypothetical protein